MKNGLQYEMRLSELDCILQKNYGIINKEAMLLNQPKAVHWESDFAVTELVLIDIGVARIYIYISSPSTHR